MDIENLIDRMKKARADGSWNTLSDLSHKAATTLEQLQAENDRLRRERDAAVEDLNAIRGDIEEIRRCKNFKWRGPKEK